MNGSKPTESRANGNLLKLEFYPLAYSLKQKYNVVIYLEKLAQAAFAEA